MTTFPKILREDVPAVSSVLAEKLHRAAVTWIPKVGWTYDEIVKMSPCGTQTHDPAATLSKLRRNLGIQVTTAWCNMLIIN